MTLEKELQEIKTGWLAQREGPAGALEQRKAEFLQTRPLLRQTYSKGYSCEQIIRGYFGELYPNLKKRLFGKPLISKDMEGLVLNLARDIDEATDFRTYIGGPVSLGGAIASYLGTNVHKGRVRKAIYGIAASAAIAVVTYFVADAVIAVNEANLTASLVLNVYIPAFLLPIAGYFFGRALCPVANSAVSKKSINKILNGVTEVDNMFMPKLQ
jgi:hypothetical protein